MPGSLKETALVKRIHELSSDYPRFGYRKIFEKLIREGIRVGRERVRLIRKREGLQVPQKQRKRLRAGKSTTDEYRALYPTTSGATTSWRTRPPMVEGFGS